MIVDDTTANVIREGAKKNKVSQSHYLNNLIQRALILEDNIEDLESFLQKPKLMTVYKKLLTYGLENLALTQYLVKNLGDENYKKANDLMLEKSHQHAESYVSGLFEE